MIALPLTQGQHTLIDDFYKDLAARKWAAQWCKNTRSFRAVQNLNGGGCVLLHRIIMARHIGRELLTREHVDHIDHDTLDNRLVNLRIAVGSQNHMNMRKHVMNTSGYKGVTWDASRNRWLAQIRVNGRNRFLGRYFSASDAAAAYDNAARMHFQEFALTNKAYHACL